MYFYSFGFILLIYGHNLYGGGKVFDQIRALFDCVSPFLMCKTRQVQVEQTQNNLEINCMLDVKMKTYLEMPKKICTPPPPKKNQQNTTLYQCV